MPRYAKAGSFLGLLLLVVGCRQTVELPLIGDDEDVVVVVTASETGIIESARILRPGIRPGPFAIRDSAHLISFHLRASDIVDERNQPMDSDGLASLRVRTPGMEPEQSSSDVPCERCLVPSTRPPFQLFPGDSCTLPTFATPTRHETNASVDGGSVSPTSGIVEEVRRQIRLERPGVCPCHRHEASAAPMVDYRPVWPLVDPWPARVTGIAPDGTFGVFTDSVAIRIAPDGRRVTKLATSTTTFCSPAPSALPFVGPVRSAVGLPAGRFITASYHGGMRRNLRFDVFNPDLSSEPMQVPYETQPDTMLYWGARDRVLLIGESLPVTPAIYSCLVAREPHRLDCELLTSRPLVGSFRDVEIVADDLIFGAMGDLGLVYGILRPSGYEWLQQSLRTVPIANGMGTRRINTLFTVGSIGDRLFACGSSDAGSVVLTATRTANPLAHQPQWSVVGELNGGSCGDITQISDDAAVLADGSLGGLVLTSTGAVSTRRRLSSIFGTSNGLNRVQRPTPGFLHLSTPVGVRYRREFGVGKPAEHIYGNLDREDVRTLATVESDGAFWAFGSHRIARRVEVVDGQVDLQTVNLEGFAASDLIVAADVDTARGGFLVGGRGGPGFLRRVATDGSVEEISLEGMFVQGEFVIALTEVVPNIHIVAGSRRTLLRLRDGVVEPIHIEWDDSMTEFEEKELTRESCKIREQVNVDSELFTVVSASHGIAWVAGCGGALLRVRALAPQAVAERVSLARPDQTLYDPKVHTLPGLTAMTAACPDNVVVAARGLNEFDTAKGRVWEVAPNTEDGRRVVDDFEGVLVRDYPPNETSQHALIGLDLGVPIALAGDADKISIVRSRGRDARAAVLRYFGERRFFWQDDLHALAQGPGGDMLLGGRADRLVYGRQCQ